jgi:hypothetical protein
MKIKQGTVTLEISFEELCALDYLLRKINTDMLRTWEAKEEHITQLRQMQLIISLWLSNSSSS